MAATQLKLFREFQDRIPGHRNGSRTSLSTFIRWAIDGVKLPDGTKVKLRAVRCGHKWLCTDEWFEAFLDAQAAPFSTPATTPPRSPAARARASAAASKRLEAMGA